MIVHFQTTNGCKYRIDHAQGRFFQESPKERSGVLWNRPPVLRGKRVSILTAPEGHGDAKLIQTGIVVERWVEL